MTEWWESGDEVHRLAQWLDNLNAFTETRDVIYFFEKPWKWTSEYEHMEKHEDAIETRAESCDDCTPRTIEEAA